MNSTQAIEKAARQAELAPNNGPHGMINVEAAKAWAMIADVLLKMEEAA